MQLRNVFSELGQGLRRNLSMHIAVILTLFVSLTLVGLGVLLNQQAQRMADQYGNELQITVFLCRDNDPDPACPTEVTSAQQKAIEDVVDKNPEVASWYVESKATAFEKVKELVGPEKFEGPNAAATVDDMPKSIWITLDDPSQFEGITSAVQGLDGVSQIRDQREVVGPLLRGMDRLQVGSFLTAVFLVVAALLLVANTIRLAALARRREIGIMRLVGASTLFITLPFLMEALVTAVLGVVLAGGTMAAFMQFGVENGLRDSAGFIPWVGWPEYGYALGAVVVLGPVLTLLPTLVLTRKYLKV
jgi:cell division transport system permease protein